MKWYVATVGAEDNKLRLDNLCRRMFPQSSYGDYAGWLRKKIISVNKKKTATSYRLNVGDIIYIAEPLLRKIPRETRSMLSQETQSIISQETAVGAELSENAVQGDGSKTSVVSEQEQKPKRGQEQGQEQARAENKISKDMRPEVKANIFDYFLEKSIIYHNKDLVVLNKYAGERIFGEDSIAEKLAEYPSNSLYYTPAPTHRLDVATSGALLCGLSRQGAEYLSRMQAEAKIHKIYIGLLHAPIYDTLLTHTLYRDQKNKLTIVRDAGHTDSTDKTRATSAHTLLGSASLYVHTLCELDIANERQQPNYQLSHHQQTDHQQPNSQHPNYQSNLRYSEGGYGERKNTDRNASNKNNGRRDTGNRDIGIRNIGNRGMARHKEHSKVYLSIAILQGSGGKTHQIRAQCAAVGAPLWGDTKYGGAWNNSFANNGRDSFFLHASTMLVAEEQLPNKSATQGSLAQDSHYLPKVLRALLPSLWKDYIDYSSHYALDDVERRLDLLALEWGEDKSLAASTAMMAFCISKLGGVIG